MSLAHSPADIIAQLLMDMNLGDEPDGDSPQWPVYVSQEPGTPDNCITVYDTVGTDFGRVQINGERHLFRGFQIRVRGKDHKTGYTKAEEIGQALDKDVYQESVTIESENYLVHAVTRTSDVIRLGTDTPTTKRHLFTVNGRSFIREL